MENFRDMRKNKTAAEAKPPLLFFLGGRKKEREMENGIFLCLQGPVLPCKIILSHFLAEIMKKL